MSQRILIDLTDIEQWNGNHGGTQRVVYGIAKNFYLNHKELKQKVRFISFDAKEKRFYFTDFGPVYRRVEGVEGLQTAKPAEQSTNEEPVSLKTKLKLRLKPYVPAQIRRNEVARKLAKLAWRIAKKIKAAISQPEPVSVAPEPKRDWLTLKEHDVVLMLGKPWDNLDIQQNLSEQRSKIGFKLVQVVYDLIICLHPHLHHPSLVEPYTKHMKGAVANSDLLLAISKSTAKDLKKFSQQHKIKPPKIEVIRLGDHINVKKAVKKLKKPDSRIISPFIACVGTVEIRKNHSLLYYTYKLAAEKGIDLPQLVIVGGQGWLSGDVQHLINSDQSVAKKIVLLHNISDDGLQWIYQKCQFTIYPSMYEGWGLPVAESLAYGKHCLTSNASSMPEIAGDLIDYFSPYNPHECLEKLAKFIKKDVLNKKEALIKKRYKTTSWQQTYGQVLEYIEQGTS